MSAFDPDVINGVEYVPLDQVDAAIEAGVQAERKRIEARIGGLLGGAYMEGENAAWNRAVDAALAVVTGKGASDER